MNDEAVLRLAEAINRLAAALERFAPSGMQAGLQVYHHGIPSPNPIQSPYTSIWGQ